MKKEASSAVKIDSYLIDQINEVLKKEEHRFRFANKKQFVDIAVNEFLIRLKDEDKKDGK